MHDVYMMCRYNERQIYQIVTRDFALRLRVPRYKGIEKVISIILYRTLLENILFCLCLDLFMKLLN